MIELYRKLIANPDFLVRITYGAFLLALYLLLIKSHSYVLGYLDSFYLSIPQKDIISLTIDFAIKKLSPVIMLTFSVFLPILPLSYFLKWYTRKTNFNGISHCNIKFKKKALIIIYLCSFSISALTACLSTLTGALIFGELGRIVAVIDKVKFNETSYPPLTLSIDKKDNLLECSWILETIGDYTLIAHSDTHVEMFKTSRIIDIKPMVKLIKVDDQAYRGNLSEYFYNTCPHEKLEIGEPNFDLKDLSSYVPSLSWSFFTFVFSRSSNFN